MGKLLDRLGAQLKTDLSQDAKDCLIIYNKLKEIHNGHVWQSDWSPLVSTRFEGSYPNSRRIFKPTNVGYIFLKGIEHE